MTEITDILKCPECYRKGTMELIVRKKTVEATCNGCGEIVTSRVPYPKHRGYEGYQYPFKIPSVRPIWTQENDKITCSQEEWDNRNS